MTGAPTICYVHIRIYVISNKKPETSNLNIETGTGKLLCSFNQKVRVLALSKRGRYRKLCKFRILIKASGPRIVFLVRDY